MADSDIDDLFESDSEHSDSEQKPKSKPKKPKQNKDLTDLKKIAKENDILITNLNQSPLSQADIYSKLKMLGLLNYKKQKENPIEDSAFMKKLKKDRIFKKNKEEIDSKIKELEKKEKEERDEIEEKKELVDRFNKEEKYKFDVMYNVFREDKGIDVIQKLIEDDRFVSLLKVLSRQQLKLLVDRYIHTPNLLSTYSNLLVYKLILQIDSSLKDQVKDINLLDQIHLKELKRSFMTKNELKNYKEEEEQISMYSETLEHNLDVIKHLISRKKDIVTLKKIQDDLYLKLKKENRFLNSNTRYQGRDILKRIEPLFPVQIERLIRDVKEVKEEDVKDYHNIYDLISQVDTISSNYEKMIYTEFKDIPYNQREIDDEKKCLSENTDAINELIQKLKNPLLNKDSILENLKKNKLCEIKHYQSYFDLDNLINLYDKLRKDIEKIHEKIQYELGTIYLPSIKSKEYKDFMEMLKIKNSLRKTFVPPKEQDQKENIKDTQTEIKLFSKKLTRDTPIIRDVLEKELSKYFHKENVVSIRDDLLQNYGNGTVDEILDKLATIVVFLDDKYMKKEAGLFNEMLRNGRVKEDEILNFGLEKMLHNLYTSFDEIQIEKLEKKIDGYIKQYKDQVIYNILLANKIKLNTKITYKVIDIYQKINVKCENDFIQMNDTVYYVELEKHFRPYLGYDIYCFSLSHLIDNDITINPYTNKPFSDDFIEFLNKFKKQEVKVDELNVMLKTLYDDIRKMEIDANMNHDMSKLIIYE
jgi:hypothetical protein